MNRTVLMAGATGFVGGLLAQGLADTAWRVTCLTRRAAVVGVRALPTDFAEAPEDLDASYDAVALCLGSTPKRAGGNAEFRAIEHGLAVRVAGWARARGARTCVYVSSLGADLSSASPYLRAKAETEQALTGLGFEVLHLFRPSFLTGRRPRPRFSEVAGALGVQAMGAIGLGPKSGAIRPIAGDALARAMQAALEDSGSGVHVHHYADIRRLAAT